MKIKSFRIKNYRSIKDSGKCYISGDMITILAGKNEAGKTAILEALEDFNTDRSIRNDAIPFVDRNSLPQIEVTFDIDKETLEEIFHDIKFDNKTIRATEISIIKEYPGNYSINHKNADFSALKDVDLSADKLQKINDLYSQVEEIYQQHQIGENLPDLDSEDISGFLNQVVSYRNEAKTLMANIPDPARTNFANLLIELIQACNDYIETSTLEQTFLRELKKWIPNFILFSSFDDIFPNDIDIDKVDTNEFIKDLALVSDFRIELIKSGSPSDKTRHKDQINIKLKDDYQKFWTQDLANLYIDWDSHKIFFFIKENGQFYTPSLRSKGKQWHLAFYVRLSARAKEDVPNVILIDEPGLFLHAKAQKDILKKLEESSLELPILFTTHSPYLFENDKLSRIRLISKNTDDGTTISNKIHKGADKDTLTPIITAIGFDLSIGLDVAKENNIICEGISDYYYLSAMMKHLDFHFDQEIHLIPCVGAGNSTLFTSLMIGWGLNYCNLLDNDSEGKKVRKKLTDAFGEENSNIIMVSDSDTDEIEDLFTKEDFAKHVLNSDYKGTDSTAESKNSKILKSKDVKYDKVLLSKLFQEKVVTKGVKLSKETEDNFQNLLERINKKLFKSNKS